MNLLGCCMLSIVVDGLSWRSAMHMVTRRSDEALPVEQGNEIKCRML